MPRITSTSFIIGTGFMKCMPMNLPGRSVAAASRVIEMEEVLRGDHAPRASAPGRALAKISRLISSFSVAASITMSQSANSA